MDGSPVLLVECVDVGSSGQQQLHHLSHTGKLTGCRHGARACMRLCACPRETHLYVSAEGGVVQGGATRPVRHVDVAEQRDQSLGATHRLVARCHVERRLPVLVPGVDIRTVLQQHRHSVLGTEVCKRRCKRLSVLT